MQSHNPMYSLILGTLKQLQVVEMQLRYSHGSDTMAPRVPYLGLYGISTALSLTQLPLGHSPSTMNDVA